MLEKEFWVAYFSSIYFHRNRNAQVNTVDIFQQFMNEDQSMDIDKIHVEPIVTRNKLMDQTLTTEDHQDTGNRPDYTMQPGQYKEALPLIRRFNMHADSVIKSNISSTGAREESESIIQGRFLEEQIRLEDLVTQVSPDYAPLIIQYASAYSGKEKKDGALLGKREVPFEELPSLKLEYAQCITGANLEVENYSKRCTDAQKNDGHRSLRTDSETLIPMHDCTLEFARHYWALNRDDLKRVQIVKVLSEMVTRINEIERGTSRMWPGNPHALLTAKTVANACLKDFNT